MRFVAVIALLSTVAAAGAESGPSVDREVLVEFYHSTGGPDWVKSDHWLSTAVPHCEWHGVRCDDDGYVVELTLFDNDLEGPLPATICEEQQHAQAGAVHVRRMAHVEDE